MDGRRIYLPTDDALYEEFKSLYPAKKTENKIVLTQKDISRFNELWAKEFISYRGRYKKKHIDKKKEAEFKKCLFTIFTLHWDQPDGFQINMKTIGKAIAKSFITVDRMILFFLKTGILCRCHNYMQHKQTYFYHKNGPLFNYLYKVRSNDYFDWVYAKNHNKDLLYLQDEYCSNSSEKKTKQLITSGKKRGRKPKTYIPDYNLLSAIVKEFLPVYDKLNKKQHEMLKINFGLRFNKNGNFTGRSHSFLCQTRNEKNDHSYDSTLPLRSEFMKELGLSGYKQVYDIKSEVPKTTILCNTGIWKPDEYDFYAKVVMGCEPLEINRELVKQLYMRFNFDTGSDKEQFNHFRNYRIFKLKCEHQISTVNATKLYYFRLENDAEYTFEEWTVMKDVINKIQGKSWGNLIFWWTSLIQTKTIFEILKDTGIRIYNVYDGFYAPQQITKKYLAAVVKKSANYIYDKYIKTTKYPY